MTSVPQTVVRELEGRRAGIASRLLADVVDFVVVLTALAAIYVAVAGLRFVSRPATFRWPQPNPATTLVVGAVVSIAYLSWAWLITGRTVGKQLAGLRVVTTEGRRLGPVQSVLRAIACLFFPLGLFWVLLSRSNSSLQDLGLRTAVVYDWRHRLPGVRSPMSP
jgi:uncharacterized RDD family membrane protein YckC